MGIFAWIRKWKESGVKLRNLGAEFNERVADLAAPLKTGASDSQIAASIQSLNEVSETLKMQWPETMRRVTK